jgi:hypothetical protein
VTSLHIALLQAIAATAAFASGLFFFRFWRRGGDTLFAYFGTAFVLLATSWGLLAFLNPAGDARAGIYGIRLLAFLLMIAAMVDKNRSGR